MNVLILQLALTGKSSSRIGEGLPSRQIHDKIRFCHQRQAADRSTNLRLCDVDSLVAYLKENYILSLCSGAPAGGFRMSTCSWGCGCAGQDAKAEAAASFQPGQTAADQHCVTLVEANPHVYVTQRYQHFKPSKPRGCQYILIVRTTRLAAVRSATYFLIRHSRNLRLPSVDKCEYSFTPLIDVRSFARSQAVVWSIKVI